MSLENNGKSKVVIAKSLEVSKAVEGALKLVGGLEKAVSNHSSIVVKPNFCGGVPGERGSHTSVAVLDALLELLAPYKRRYSSGNQTGALTGLMRFSSLNIHDLARRYGLR